MGAEPEDWSEAVILINNQRLTVAQSMTVRVALESFALSLAAGLGDDAHGRVMTKAYQALVAEIRLALYRHLPH